MRDVDHRSVIRTQSAASRALAAVQVAGLALSAIVGGTAIDAGVSGARNALELGARKIMQPHGAPIDASLARAHPLPPSLSFVAQAEAAVAYAEVEVAHDFFELGLRVRPISEADAAAIESAGLPTLDTSVRVVNAVAGQGRGFERGDLIAGTCEGERLLSGQAGCVLVVRDGVVLRL
jgi:hypothetical protein